MIRFACPGCSATYTSSDEKAGKTSKCPKCGTQFVIPGPEDAAAPPALPSNSPPPPPPPPSRGSAIEIAPCPKCGTKLTVEPGDLGADVECPSCQKIFTARKPGSSAGGFNTASKGGERSSRRDEEDEDRPRRRRDEDEDDRPRRRRRDEDEDDRPRSRRDEDDEDYDDRPRRRRRRGSHSDAVSMTSGPGTALMVVGILGLCLTFCGTIGILADLRPKGRGPDDTLSNVIGIILGFCWSGAVIMGGINVKGATNYAMAMTGTIIAMLPCSACCILGLPFGIWSLVTLLRDDVKRGFQS